MEKEIIHLYRSKEVFCRISGNGKPVMLIHGFGEDGEIWEKQVDYLKEEFRVIVPDLPGSGRSAMIDDMRMEGLADALHSVAIEVLGDDSGKIEKFSMIGHSMGGYVALAYAEKFISELNGLCLFHSTSFADSEEKKRS